MEKISEIITGGYQLALSESAQQKIITCRSYLDQKLKNSDHPFYGINTGFGSLQLHCWPRRQAVSSIPTVRTSACDSLARALPT